MANSRNQSIARARGVVKPSVPVAGGYAHRRWWRWGLALAGAVGVACAIWRFADNEMRTAYPVRYVRIESAAMHLNEAEFTEAIAPLIRTGVFGVDLNAVAAAAASFAWVERVRAVRRWPDTLILQLREHRPVARWNEDSLLSDRGTRFEPPDLQGFSDLPRLYGRAGQEADVLDVWRKMNELLRPRNWRVTMLSSNFRQSWTARLSDGKELILGRQDPLASVSRLLTMLPELGPRQTAAIRKIDLRYRNGFAVVWRFEQESEPEPAEQAGPKPEVWKRAPGLTDHSPRLAANQW